MKCHLPYYMAYPMPLLYDDAKIEKRDYEYMKSMYPMTAKKVLPFVEEELERLEYEGSVIFDEYPDQLQIRMICNRVFNKLKDMEEEEENFEKENSLKELIQIMVFQELYQSRCNHRRCRRKIY